MGGLELTVAMGFDGSDISWFTCHAFGGDFWIAADFFQTCWEAAAISEADQEATAAWIGATTAWHLEGSRDLSAHVGRSCPVRLLAVSMNTTPSRVNAQLTISRAELC